MPAPHPDIKPLCECGGEGCYPTILPHAAWEAAGEAGAGKGVDGTDLIAVAPGHETGYAVLRRGAGYLVCGWLAPVELTLE